MLLLARDVEGHAAADRQVVHAWADRFDGAGSLVPHDERRNPPTGRASEPVHVAAANAAGGHPHQHLTRGWSGRFDVDDRELARSGKKQSLHTMDEFIRSPPPRAGCSDATFRARGIEIGPRSDQGLRYRSSLTSRYTDCPVGEDEST